MSDVTPQGERRKNPASRSYVNIVASRRICDPLQDLVSYQVGQHPVVTKGYLAAAILPRDINGWDLKEMAADRYAALKDEVVSYADENGYPVSHFEPIKCGCGQEELLLFSDDDEGGAFAECPSCRRQTDIMDSRQYAQDAVQNVCSCDHEPLLLGVGTAVYDDGTDDVRWVYVGGLCKNCGLAGVYTDWHER